MNVIKEFVLVTGIVMIAVGVGMWFGFAAAIVFVGACLTLGAINGIRTSTDKHG